MGAIHLWPQIFGYELTIQEFFWTYQSFALFGEAGFFSLSARHGRKIIDKCQSSNKGWNGKFFHMSTLGLYEENPESHRLLLSGQANRGVMFQPGVHISTLAFHQPHIDSFLFAL